MTEPAKTGIPPWLKLVAVVVGVVLLVPCAFLAVITVRGPQYPRDKAAAFERLRLVGHEDVVREGRELMGKRAGVVPHREVPPAIGALEGEQVEVDRTTVTIRYRQLGGGYGFEVVAEGEKPMLGETEVAPGLYWFDAHDAPESMRGLPPEWERR